MFYLLFLLIPFFSFSFEISSQAANEIGIKIWKNECGGTVDGLVFWNPKEECLSLGIGHFIWYPSSTPQKFDAMFDQYLVFLKDKKIPIPFSRFSWKTRQEFLAATQEVASLKKWLAETIEFQTEFIIIRLDSSLLKIQKNAKVDEKSHLKSIIDALTSKEDSLFALIDYLNFKGEGLSLNERYQGKGWGLYQVLMGMDAPTLKSFKLSAIARLKERVMHAPKDESRWLNGWENRINRY